MVPEIIYAALNHDIVKIAFKLRHHIYYCRSFTVTVCTPLDAACERTAAERHVYRFGILLLAYNFRVAVAVLTVANAVAYEAYARVFKRHLLRRVRYRCAGARCYHCRGQCPSNHTCHFPYLHNLSEYLLYHISKLFRLFRYVINVLTLNHNAH